MAREASFKKGLQHIFYILSQKGLQYLCRVKYILSHFTVTVHFPFGFVTALESGKRKAEQSNANSSDAKQPRTELLLQDMAVMNLPFDMSEKELKSYFETNYGEVDFLEV